MNTFKTLMNKTFLVASLSIASLASLPVSAEAGSAHHSGQASKHSVLAVAHGVGSSVKVASAVVAAPIVVVGAVSLAAGSAVVAIGDSIAASGQSVSVHPHHNAPLEITNIVITADPAPNQFNANKPEHEIKTTTITTTETSKAVEKTTVEKKQK